MVDSAKIDAIADAVGKLSSRFDAMRTGKGNTTRLEPMTNEGFIIRYKKKLQEAKNAGKPEMIALYERQLKEYEEKAKNHQ